MSIDTEIAYHHWANVRLLEHISRLKKDIFMKEVKSIFPSLAAAFEHIYKVDALWLKRILGEKQPDFEEVTFETPIDAIKHFESNLVLFKQLSSKKEIIVYKNTKGEIFRNDSQEIFRHLVNHGTYHRGNVSAMLHQLGEKSVSNDYIIFLREEI
ncbi:DinB family protein [Neobacillus mesonae]|uniref:DinB family protein n=1 Tax=Neobacillus mesonae TaxID=1193713 RepID=UPI00203A56CF|nr:DinB family protein [Neobacillus mesonae]MCM3569271.1 damage-inducible protein DinB [Neobacillus mesonae]